jgi:hypothetical protein
MDIFGNTELENVLQSGTGIIEVGNQCSGYF